jgi:mannitol-1-/sugar-/sorbitol-6-phosphatase
VLPVPRDQAAGNSTASEKPPSLTLLLEGNAAELYCRAVLFDMDGVLVESKAVICRQLHDWAARHGLDAKHVIETSHGLTSTDLIRAVAPWLDVAQEARAMDEREISDVRGIRAGAGATALTDSLPRASWAVVTSADPRVAHARLAAAGIVGPPVLVSATDVERGKPDPQGYLLAADRIGVGPSDCVVIEDAAAGVAAARSAGCQVIAVSRTVESSLLDADFVVPNLTAVSLLSRPVEK